MPHLRAGNLRYYPIELDAASLTGLVKRFSRQISKTAENKRDARQLYRILLENGIETLVIIPDGPLRTLPFSALHDGNMHVLDKPYAVTITPSLALLNPSDGEGHCR